MQLKFSWFSYIHYLKFSIPIGKALGQYHLTRKSLSQVHWGTNKTPLIIYRKMNCTVNALFAPHLINGRGAYSHRAATRCYQWTRMMMKTNLRSTVDFGEIGLWCCVGGFSNIWHGLTKKKAGDGTLIGFSPYEAVEYFAKEKWRCRKGFLATNCVFYFDGYRRYGSLALLENRVFLTAFHIVVHADIMYEGCCSDQVRAWTVPSSAMLF